MPQQVRIRKQNIVTFSASNIISEKLSRGMVYRELMLRLRGSPTVSSTDNTSAKTKLGDFWNVIRSLKIIANHTEVLKHVRGRDIWAMNYKWFGMKPEKTSTLGDGETANPSIDETLILPFWMPRSAKPIDTALDAKQLSGLDVEVEWGDYTDVNGDASGWEKEPSLQVYSLESFNISGPFSQWRLYPIEDEVTSDNPEFQVNLPVGPMYRGFTIFATDGGALAGDIINNIKLRSGSTVFEDINSHVANTWFPLRNGCEYNPSMQSDDYDQAGVYYIDHVTDGYNSEAIDTLGFSEFTLELDVSVGSGTTKVVIYPDQIYPVRGQNKQ
jgi:hypothetical protein